MSCCPMSCKQFRYPNYFFSNSNIATINFLCSENIFTFHCCRCCWSFAFCVPSPGRAAFSLPCPNRPIRSDFSIEPCKTQTILIGKTKVNHLHFALNGDRFRDEIWYFFPINQYKFSKFSAAMADKMKNAPGVGFLRLSTTSKASSCSQTLRAGRCTVRSHLH